MRKILVVGAGSGLGQRLVESLKADDEEVIGSTRSDMDISQPGQVSSFIRVAGPFSHVVVTAGVYGPLNNLEYTEARKWEYAVIDNLVGPVNVCREVLRDMKAAGYGKIVLLSGGGATKPMPCASAYAASKAGLVRFAESLAYEVYDDHIYVNCVAPGIMPTKFVTQAIKVGPNVIGIDVYNESKAVWDDVEGNAFEAPIKLIKFLLSEKSDKISGKLISAVHDHKKRKWEDILRGLNSIYTLRRVD